MSANQKVSLRTGLDPAFLPLALGFTEESARVFGLDDRASAKLRLACEEVFLYLCKAANTGKAVTLEAENRIYYVSIAFLFEGLDFDPHALNFTARVLADGEGVD